jgi:two-component system nitrogen regulation response regulator GlnG
VSISVLLADDDAALRLVLQQAFAREAFSVRATATLSALLKWAKDGEGDVVVSDVYLGDECVFDVLPNLRAARPDLPVIVMSGQNHVLTATRAAERGAFDYLPKPFDLDALIAATRRAAVQKPDAKTRAAQNAAVRDAALPLIGRSAVMQELYRTLARVAVAELSVLIEGEVGVGKLRIARALHDHSRRRDRPFVRWGLSGTGENEIAAQEEATRPLLADAGTLFLDDIQDLGPSGQAVLQRVLDSGAAGASRIVAASTPGLEHAQTFRRDLYYRLAQVTLHAPPLRERLEDVPELARALLVTLTREGYPERALDTAGAEALCGHDWPGNVRELENFLRRMAVLRPEPVLRAQEIESDLNAMRRQTQALVGPRVSLEAVIAQSLAVEYGQALPDNLYDKALPAFERPLIAMALKAADGSQIRAAAILGINRNTLRKKMQVLGISPARHD